jgi:hypothetical protein
MIEQIQELHKAGVAVSEIARVTGKSWKTVKKYLEGDPGNLCKTNGAHSCLEQHTDFIIKSINQGLTQSAIARLLIDLGYTGTTTNARAYITKTATAYGLELSKYSIRSSIYSEDGNRKPNLDHIKRKGIFNYLWMNGELQPSHREYLWKQYPILWEVGQCIRDFRECFFKKNLPLLYLFIERYKTSNVKELSCFANGLEKDINAVENAVASDLSNGFVEGTNSKLKMVKRTMYGRCNKKLLEAKLMYCVSG